LKIHLAQPLSNAEKNAVSQLLSFLATSKSASKKEILQKNQINFENQSEKFTLVKSIPLIFNKTAIK